MSTSGEPIKKISAITDVARQNEETRAKAQATLASFVHLQIETGLLFCRIMKQMSQNGDQARAFQRAQAAYNAAQDWIWKLRMPHSEFDQITAHLEHLRFELNNLEHRK